MDEQMRIELGWKLVDALMEKFSLSELELIRNEFDGEVLFNACGEAIAEIKDQERKKVLRERLSKETVAWFDREMKI